MCYFANHHRSSTVMPASLRHASVTQRRAASLLEVILAIAITASMAGVLTTSIEVVGRIWRVQEGTSSFELSQSAVDWITVQIRQANNVRIVNAGVLELTTQSPSGAVVRRIYRQGNRLLMSQSGQVSIVMEPVSQLVFTDPTGRGVAIRVQLTGGGTGTAQVAMQQDRTIARDWLKS